MSLIDRFRCWLTGHQWGTLTGHGFDRAVLDRPTDIPHSDIEWPATETTGRLCYLIDRCVRCGAEEWRFASVREAEHLYDVPLSWDSPLAVDRGVLHYEHEDGYQCWTDRIDPEYEDFYHITCDDWGDVEWSEDEVEEFKTYWKERIDNTTE